MNLDLDPNWCGAMEMVRLEVDKSHGDGGVAEDWGLQDLPGWVLPAMAAPTGWKWRFKSWFWGSEPAQGHLFGMWNQGLSSLFQHLLLAEEPVGRWGARQGVCCGPGLICSQSRDPIGMRVAAPGDIKWWQRLIHHLVNSTGAKWQPEAAFSQR